MLPKMKGAARSPSLVVSGPHTRHRLAELLGDSLEIAQRYLALALHVKQRENLHNVLAAILVRLQQAIDSTNGGQRWVNEKLPCSGVPLAQCRPTGSSEVSQQNPALSAHPSRSFAVPAESSSRLASTSNSETHDTMITMNLWGTRLSARCDRATASLTHHFCGHHVEELLKVDLPALVLIHVRDHLTARRAEGWSGCLDSGINNDAAQKVPGAAEANTH
jgi:hypothetical protein